MFKKFLLVLAFFTLHPLSLHCMTANPIARMTAKELLKKGIEKGTTGLHWAIAAGPFWGFGLQSLVGYPFFESLVDQKRNSLKNIMPWVEQEGEKWIKKELKGQGMKDVENLLLDPNYDEFNFSGVGFLNKKKLGYSLPTLVSAAGAIYLDIKNHDHGNGFDILVDHILDRELRSFPKDISLNELRAVLSHEKVHIENKHVQRAIAAALLAPILTHYSVNKIFSKSVSAKPFSFFRTMASAFTKLGINAMLFWSVVNAGEKEADEGVVNDVEILEGAAKLFNRMAESEVAFKDEWFYRVARFLDPHPDALKRAERFEERANELRMVPPTNRQKKIHEVYRAQLRAAQQKI
jgi:Peptidase family M48